MRRLLVLVPLTMVVVVGTLQPQSGAALLTGHDSGRSRLATITIYDSQELEECPPEYGEDCPEDIRSASLRTYTGGTGRRMLAVRVEAYELHGGLLFIDNIKFRFDARGGPHADWFVFISITGLANSIGWACDRKFGDAANRRYHVKVRGDSMTCLIPLEDLHPTKPIRFQVYSRGTRYVVDRAPDQGWAG